MSAPTTTRSTLQAIMRITRGPAPTQIVADTGYTFDVGDPSNLSHPQRMAYAASICNRLGTRGEGFSLSIQQTLSTYVSLMLALIPGMRARCVNLNNLTLTLTPPAAADVTALDALAAQIATPPVQGTQYVLPAILGMVRNEARVDQLGGAVTEQAMVAVLALLTQAIFKEYVDVNIGGKHAGEEVFAKSRPAALAKVANLSGAGAAWILTDGVRPSKHVFIGINRLFSILTQLRRSLMEEYVEWQRVDDVSINRRIMLTTIQLSRWAGIGFVGHVRDLAVSFPQVMSDPMTAGEWTRFVSDSNGVAGILPFTQRFLGAINGPALPIWRRRDYPALVTISTLHAIARGEKSLKNYAIFKEYKVQAIATLASWGFTMPSETVDVIEVD